MCCFYVNHVEFMEIINFEWNGPLQKAWYSLGNIDVSAPGAPKDENSSNSNKKVSTKIKKLFMSIFNLKKFKLVFQEVLRLFLIFVLVFQIFRIAIYYSYRDLFNNLDFLKLTESLFLGLRFDLSSTSILLFIPIVLLF